MAAIQSSLVEMIVKMKVCCSMGGIQLLVAHGHGRLKEVRTFIFRGVVV